MREGREGVGRCEEVGCAEAVVGVDLDFGDRLDGERGEGEGGGGRHCVGWGLCCGEVLGGVFDRGGIDF